MNTIEIVFSIYGMIAIALVLVALKKIDADNKKIKKRMLKEADNIVRCKDCKYYTESIYFAPEKMCYRYYDNDGDVIGYIKSDNDYCSYAERRESE